MPRLALAQAWLWGIGVLLFARGQISGGLESMPRRTMIDSATYSLPGWDLANWLTGIGGVIMTVSGILFFIVIVGTLFFSAPLTEPIEVPVTETMRGPQESWRIFDRLGFWCVVAIALGVLAYAPVFIGYLPGNFTSPGLKVW
jgi:cytochrome c oxidase subunit 1